MGRKRVGSVFIHGESVTVGHDKKGKPILAPAKDGVSHWDCRITKPDGTRSKPICLPGYSKEKAREKAQVLTELADKEFAIESKKPVKGETVAEWFGRYFAHCETRGVKTVSDMRGNFKKWTPDELKAKPIAEVTTVDIEAWVEEMDGNVLEEEIKGKTAINIFATLRKGFTEASNSKVKALRVLAKNPAMGVRGPDMGIRRAKAYLYPSEFAQLVRSNDVPLEWKRAVTLAIYTFTRAAELRALTWDDIDLEHGIIHIHHTLDRDGMGHPTKTKNARRFAIEPALLPLLRAMRDEAGGKGRVTPLPNELSRPLRSLLKRAGVNRADIHADDQTRKNLTWHDLRATGLTWLAIKGVEPLKIMSMAGHSDFKMTMAYVREADHVGEGFGTPFPALPALQGDRVASEIKPGTEDLGDSTEEFAPSSREAIPLSEARSSVIPGDSARFGSCDADARGSKCLISGRQTFPSRYIFGGVAARVADTLDSWING